MDSVLGHILNWVDTISVNNIGWRVVHVMYPDYEVTRIWVQVPVQATNWLILDQLYNL